ncbi:sulfotransferase family protein [Amaricoccus macauensis]|uniref:sulfotransferase family protein n=1 Tax=Amaricoccus macauensis TaxID=57001 RepID=UPI003C7B89C6
MRDRNSQRQLKVDFIGIGVQKAATSWLHDVLSAHSGIEASTPKEIDFFTHHVDRGYEWYESFFRSDEADVKRGECSPSYFYSLSAPARANAYNPEFRIIAILRDPVARAFSNHLHEIRKGHIPDTRTFEDALEANPLYVEQGRYKRNLERWLDVFGREAVLVLLAEDIAADPETAYARVCAHLGVSSEVRPDTLGERSHESVASRNAGFQKVLRSAGDAARSLGLGDAVRSVKAAPGVRDLLALNKRDLRSEIAPMLPETRERLSAQFQEDIGFVAELLERETLPWPSQSKSDPEVRVNLEVANAQ